MRPKLHEGEADYEHCRASHAEPHCREPEVGLATNAYFRQGEWVF